MSRRRITSLSRPPALTFILVKVQAFVISAIVLAGCGSWQHLQDMSALRDQLTTEFGLPFGLGVSANGKALTLSLPMPPAQAKMDVQEREDLSLRIARFARLHYAQSDSLQGISVIWMAQDTTGIAPRWRTKNAWVWSTTELDRDAPVANVFLGPVPMQLTVTALQPGIDTLAVTMRQSGHVDTLVTETRELRLAGRDGRPSWVYAITRIDRNGDDMTDTVTLDGTTLAPIVERRHTVNGSVDIEYHGTRIHETLDVASPASGRRDTTIDTAPYPAGAIDVLLRALPLSAGYATRIPLYYPAPVGLRWANVSVMRPDPNCARRGQSTQCWVVTMNVLGLGARTYWITRTSRQLAGISDATDPSRIQMYWVR